MLNFFNISFLWLNAIFNSNKSKFLHLSHFKELSKFLPIFLSRLDMGFLLNNNNFFYFLFFFKKHMYLRYSVLSDIICIDLLRAKERFQIYYYLLSFVNTSRLFFKLFVNELSYIPSISFLYKSAIWYEREVWDLFGIFFKKNQDMRRILTDYGFTGHPLRKDFPLSGFVELFFDDWQKKLVYEKVSFAQEYRMFHFDNPWRQKHQLTQF